MLWIGLEHWTTYEGLEGKVYQGLWSATVNVTTTSGKNKEMLDDKERKFSQENRGEGGGGNARTICYFLFLFLSLLLLDVHF